jgi:hypothetical protein
MFVNFFDAATSENAISTKSLCDCNMAVTNVCYK